jgi:hypothetical protein
MSTRRRLYVPLVVDYFDDPRVVEAAEVSPWCEILWTRVLCKVKATGTDGAVTRPMILTLRVPQWTKWVDELVRVGLLDETETGWSVRSWERHNLTMEEVDRKRADVADRVRKHRTKTPVTPDVTPEPVSSNDTCNALQPSLPLRKKVEGRRTSKDVPSPSDSVERPGTDLEPVPPSPRDLERLAWDRINSVLTDRFENVTAADQLAAWTTELDKAARRALALGRTEPLDPNIAALAARLAADLLTIAGTRPDLVTKPDRAAILSALEPIIRSGHTNPTATRDRWRDRLETQALLDPRRPVLAVHIARNVLAGWLHPEPTQPATQTRHTAAQRQTAHLQRIGAR